MSAPKIVKPTHAIHQGLSKRPLYMEYVWKIVENVSGFNLRRSFVFDYLPSFPLGNNLAWSCNPSKNPVSGQRSTSKKHTTSMSYWPERAILSRDNGHEILFSGTWLGVQTYGRTYVRTVTVEQNFCDYWVPDILWYGTPPTCRRRPEAPLSLSNDFL